MICPSASNGCRRSFARELPGVKNHIYLPRDQEANHNSGYIIRELCKKLNEDYDSNLPQVEAPLPRIPIDLFLSIERETPPYAHMAIMDRMFLELTEESATIMEGDNRRSKHRLA